MPNDMMHGPMMGGLMVVCTIAAALFALTVLVVLIIQAVLQWKILREVRGVAMRPPEPARQAEPKRE
jgi:predicted lipid-binding transport protein (Tim44 family)